MRNSRLTGMKLVIAALLVTGSALLVACSGNVGFASEEKQTEATQTEASQTEDQQNENEHPQIQILATSDVHGWFMPYNYIKNKEDLKGSFAQVATAVDELRNDNTILVDAGDLMAGNGSEIFTHLESDPMSDSTNLIGYDYVVPGNHSFNFGMDFIQSSADRTDAVMLCGNLYDQSGKAMGKPYEIVEKGGVMIGIIGMVTPNIAKWDADILKGWKVTDPAEETRKSIEEIKDKVDVLVGVMHMDIKDELDTPHSGIASVAEACPELDVIVAAHGHQRIGDMEINGVRIIENDDSAETMGQILIDMEKDEQGWKIAGIDTKLLEMKDYAPKKKFCNEMTPYHEIGVANAELVIGTLDSDYLAAPDEMKGIRTAFIEDSGVIDLLIATMLHYTDARVAAVGIGDYDANLHRGDIRNCDISKVFGYDNMLYVIKMNGAQLKKWMEWSARFYNTTKPGDLTVSFNKDIRLYSCDFFGGVNYEINISKEPGNRIENLTWPDGTPVKDDDEFLVASQDYRVNANMKSLGTMFGEREGLPEIVKMDVRSDVGDMKCLIRDYIYNVKGGHIKNECDHNWKLTGYDFDKEYRQKAKEYLESGKLTLEHSKDGRTPNTRSITIDDVKAVE